MCDGDVFAYQWRPLRGLRRGCHAARMEPGRLERAP
jgi:hypothetical protein